MSLFVVSRRFKWTYEHTVATLQYMYRGVVFLCNKLMKKREVVVSEDETSEEEEESIQISVSSCSSSESDDDSVLQNPAAVAGMGVLLGYNRSKRYEYDLLFISSMSIMHTYVCMYFSTLYFMIL